MIVGTIKQEWRSRFGAGIRNVSKWCSTNSEKVFVATFGFVEVRVSRDLANGAKRIMHTTLNWVTQTDWRDNKFRQENVLLSNFGLFTTLQSMTN